MSGKKSKAQREQAAQRREYLASKRAPAQYWHGGAPGRSVGDEILSRDDAARLLTIPTTHGLQSGYALGVTRPDRVYFSSDRNFARAYAAKHQRIDQTTGVVYERGTLYRVEPVGPVEEDPDFAGRGVSSCAAKARIVAVEDTDVYMEATEATQYIGPHMTWDDGSPIYGTDGSYQPNPVLRRSGFTASHFEGRYPTWFPFELVDADLANRPGSDRPDPSRCKGIEWSAASTAVVYRTLMSRTGALRERGIKVRPYNLSDVDAVNDLLARVGHHTRVQSSADEPRGVLLAEDLHGGLIGAVVITAANFQGRSILFIDAIATTEKWRHEGVATVLLNAARELVPTQVEFIGGHCPPDVAPFFAQAGFTVLRPGIKLAIPIPGDPRLLGGVDDEAWFYRQSAI